MKKVFFWALISLLAPGFNNAYVVVNYHTSNCGGTGDVSCRGNSLNAAGDLVVWNTQGIATIDYGEIKELKTINALMGKYNKLILSFLPTKVSSLIKGNSIRVLFVLLPINNFKKMNLPDSVIANIKDLQLKDRSAQTAIIVYRQIISPSKIADESEWVDVAVLGTMAKPSEIKQIKADLSPDGIATVYTKDINGHDIPTVINLAMEY